MNRTISKLCRTFAVICLTLICASFAWSQNLDNNIRVTAEQFVSSNELKLQKETNLVDQFFLLEKLGPAALAAGDAEKAGKYAREMAAVADKLYSEQRGLASISGEATHISNIVLGRIAFDNGDINKAKEHLLAAGHVIGNPPTLVSFGPDMLLAKQLLEKGERETVIQYLDLCAVFWKKDDGKLEQWKNVVRQGKTPEFGHNLSTKLYSWRFAQ